MGKSKSERAAKWAKSNRCCPKCGGSNIIEDEENAKNRCGWCKNVWPMN